MNGIINFSLRNKLAIWILILIVSAAGIYSGLKMKMETIPNINIPFVSITTSYPGAPPEEIDKDITIPLQKQLQSLPDVKAVSTTSLQNASIVEVEYPFNKDMDKAVTQVKEAIDNLHLPDGVESPKVSRESFDAFPILALSVTNKGQPIDTLTHRVKHDIVPALEDIDGVASVQIYGQQIQEVDLTFDDHKLAQYGLSEEAVKDFIKGSAVSVPLGLYHFGNAEKTVVVDGQITTLNGLRNLQIPIEIGQTSNVPFKSLPAPEQTMDPSLLSAVPTVKLSDIARIQLVDKKDSISRTNGMESIGIQIVKSSDANTVDVVNHVKDKLKSLQKKYNGLQVMTSFDQGEPIQKSVKTMFSKAILGAVFSALIILLFLKNFRTTIISVISIPLSLLIALLILKHIGITLNIMTLGAMTVAIGRVIDDSIVVIENIYRRMSLTHEDLKGTVLIRHAAKEMFLPIMSSTIVTVAVFLPLGFVQGTVGELFMPFAQTIVFSLAASLLIAITVVPMLTHTFFKRGLVKKDVDQRKPDKLPHFYKQVLNWSLNHKWVTFGFACLLLVGSLFLVPLIGVSFLPSDEQKMIAATFNPAPGETKQEVEKTTKMAEDYFRGRPGVNTVQYLVGSENPLDPATSNQALFFVKYDQNASHFSHEQDKVMKDLKGKTHKGDWGTMDISSTGGDFLKLYVYGDNEKDIATSIQKITDSMKKDPSFIDVKSRLSRVYDQYTLVADQPNLAFYGLTAGQIGMSLGSVGEKPVLTTIKKDGRDIRVYAQGSKRNYKNVTELTNTKVQSPLGMKVPLKDVVKVKKAKAPDMITKRNGLLYTSITAQLTTKNVGKASSDLRREIDKIHLPKGTSVEFGGVTKQMNDSFARLKLSMLAAVAIVYLILVITFGNGLAPFAILFSLPFTLIGGLLALYLSGETISVSAMIGALMLIGIVIANAIVLIDRVTHKEKEGLSTRDALLEAAGTRLRPILMTAIATIGALIPLASGMEGGGIISKGLGVIVIGGLTSSTLLTLLIVPIVYEVLAKFRKKSYSYPMDADYNL